MKNGPSHWNPEDHPGPAAACRESEALENALRFRRSAISRSSRPMTAAVESAERRTRRALAARQTASMAASNKGLGASRCISSRTAGIVDPEKWTTV